MLQGMHIYARSADGPIKHMFNKTVDRAVGTGTRAKLAKAVADNAIWMPVSTCLFFAVLKLAQGQPEEIVSSCQVSKKADQGITFVCGLKKTPRLNICA